MITKLRNLIKFGILILALILGISLIKSITKIVGSNQKITDAEAIVNQLKKENQNLEREFKNAKSTEFIEEMARNKLGLAKNGEIVLVMPDADSLRALAPKIPEEKFALPLPIWQKWLKLFL